MRGRRSAGRSSPGTMIRCWSRSPPGRPIPIARSAGWIAPSASSASGGWRRISGSWRASSTTRSFPRPGTRRTSSTKRPSCSVSPAGGTAQPACWAFSAKPSLTAIPRSKAPRCRPTRRHPTCRPWTERPLRPRAPGSCWMKSGRKSSRTGCWNRSACWSPIRPCGMRISPCWRRGSGPRTWWILRPYTRSLRRRCSRWNAGAAPRLTWRCVSSTSVLGSGWPCSASACRICCCRCS